MYTNTRIADSVVTNEEYAKRAAELGHGIISTMEHGWQGRYIEGYELAKKYNLKFVFGSEVYWVKDRMKILTREIKKANGETQEQEVKDSSNCHACIFARNERGRQAINDILSEANLTGFYVRPRVDLELIFSLPPEDVIITSACVAFWKYDDVDDIVRQLHEYFGKNFFLEVQYHNTDKQREINKHILELSTQYNIPLIMGCDSHYIYPEQDWERTDFLASKGLHYEDEQGWYLDYPDGNTAYKRFADQCVLSHEQIMEAINNTNVFLEVEEYDCPIFNKELKLPTIYPELTQEERDKKFVDLIWKLWEEQKHEVPQTEWWTYVMEISAEVQTVVDTHTADYFLIDYEIVKLAKKKGGELTPSGRGSGPSFFINKLLGFTKIDRIASKVKMYPERFMSTERILASKSLPDIDQNCADVSIFWQAQKTVIGHEHAYQMVAYGQMQPAAAWKMYAKASNLEFEIANEVSKQIKRWQMAVNRADEDEKDEVDIYDYIAPEYREIYEKSKEYQGIVSSWSPHACFTGNELVYTNRGYDFIKNITCNDYVLDINGTYQKVLATQQLLSKDVLHLHIENVGKIEATKEHPFYVSGSYKQKNKRYLKEPKWKNAGDLQNGDYVAIPIEKCKNKIPKYKDVPTNNPIFWWVVGRYLGDGWLEKLYQDRKGNYVITICCSKTDVGELGEILEKFKQLSRYKTWIDNEKTIYKIHVSNKNLYHFLEQFGKGAENKTITSSIFDLPREYIQTFLDGYISADGYKRKNGSVNFSSVSKKLAFGVAKCVLLAYQTPCSIIETIPVASTLKDGRTIHAKHIRYSGSFYPFETKRKRYIKDENNIWVAYKKTEKSPGIQYVYNLEVENSHTYTLNNVIVHNCASLLYQGNIRKEIGLVYLKPSSGKKEGIVCCLMDGHWAEDYKFLKNDWLTVKVVKLMYKVYRRIGMEIPTVNQLLQMCAEDNNKTWDIYRRKCTLGINQVEQAGTSARVGIYAPQNISELCAFVAAIRPGFKSMYKIFESRKPFSYNIPSFDALIQTEEMPNSFVLYQEMAMAALNYAGIPMSDCYTVIKHIAKKRVEKVLAYKNTFVTGFAKKIMDAEHKSEADATEISHRIWQILEDSSRYSFNASHSYCVSLDGLYCAWAKAHYPLEFYESFLQILEEKGDKDRMKAVQLEATQYFNINFPPFKYGQDNTGIALDQSKNSITNSLASVKGFGKTLSKSLLECSKQDFKYFTDVLVWLKTKKRITPTKIEPLIKIGYFSEFGNITELTEILNAFDFLNQGEAKQVSKEKLAGNIIEPVIASICSDLKKDRTPGKSYIINCPMKELLNAIEVHIRHLHLQDITFKEKMDYQESVLGYIDLTTGKPEDVRKLYISDVFPLKSKNSNHIWAYVLETKSLGTGKTSNLNVEASIFNQNPIQKSDVIYADHVFKNKQGYWYLDKYNIIKEII